MFSAGLIFKNEYEKLWKSCFRSRATQLRQPPVGPSIHPSICPPIIQQSVRLSRLLILGNLQVAAPVKKPDWPPILTTLHTCTQLKLFYLSLCPSVDQSVRSTAKNLLLRHIASLPLPIDKIASALLPMPTHTHLQAFIRFLTNPI